MYRKKKREKQVEEVEGLYSDKGRPGIDPVSLFKHLSLTGFIYKLRLA